ncbi:uncharacterized protein PAC_09667 [Phialocephala subalpina]|uniref:Uncharacterized protein n=1 Tax=Phialocephala subalpina TaxID=576137 RepID=A0A1L7X422_9HELO|nr:uncharacterized protein PAC_09667 [Phialocephala subalpina]
MGRDASCWEAIESARETFIRIAEEIKIYLEKYSDPVPQQVTWTIYMIGRTRETAEPTIIFCCRDSDCRKQVRKTVEGSKILDKYPGVRVGDASQPPDFDQLVQLARESFHSGPDNNLNVGCELDGSNVLVYKAQSTNIVLDKRIYIHTPGQKNAMRKATAGGILRSGDTCFYLTAGHPFEPVLDTSENADEGFEFDIGQESDSEDEVFTEATSRGSLTPDFDECSSSDDNTLSVNTLDDGLPRINVDSTQIIGKGKLEDSIWSTNISGTADGRPTAEFTVVGHKVESDNDPSPLCLDYALVKINDRFISSSSKPSYFLDLFNRVSLDSKAIYLWPDEVSAAATQNTAVLALTCSAGLLRGTISGTPTYSNRPGSSKFQELWTARFDGKLADGDCGSWVIDAVTGNLFGHIVAGSPDSGVAYIVPAFRVFEDARTRFGLELELSIKQAFSEPPKKPQVIAESSTPAGIILPMTDDKSMIDDDSMDYEFMTDTVQMLDVSKVKEDNVEEFGMKGVKPERVKMKQGGNDLYSVLPRSLEMKATTDKPKIKQPESNIKVPSSTNVTRSRPQGQQLSLPGTHYRSSSHGRRSHADLLEEAEKREKALTAEVHSLQTRLSVAQRDQWHLQNLRTEHQKLVNEHYECRHLRAQLEGQAKEVRRVETMLADERDRLEGLTLKTEKLEEKVRRQKGRDSEGIREAYEQKALEVEALRQRLVEREETIRLAETRIAEKNSMITYLKNFLSTHGFRVE